MQNLSKKKKTGTLSGSRTSVLAIEKQAFFGALGGRLRFRIFTVFLRNFPRPCLRRILIRRGEFTNRRFSLSCAKSPLTLSQRNMRFRSVTLTN